jgi:hypothetical protein
MFNTLFEDTIRLIEKWKPKEEYENENMYRDDLLDFLREKFEKSSNPLVFQQKVSVRNETDRALSDISINGYEIGIEVKKDLRDKSQIDILIGKIAGYKKEYNDVILLLVGEVYRNTIEYCKDKSSGLIDRQVFELDKEPRIKIIVKGKEKGKGGSKSRKDSIFREIPDFGL